jgi:phosphoglycolate phosphatase-like HAD superfamily hydrolase
MNPARARREWLGVKLFVWDLHGTLEYGNHRAVIDISNRVLADYGHRERLTYEDGRKLYGLKWFEYFTWLFGDDSYERAIELQEACFEISETDLDVQCHWMRPTAYAADVLSEIAARHDQILISNTRASTLDLFLKVLEFNVFFPDGRAFAVDQHARVVARTKADVLNGFLGEGHAYEQLVIVGDSPSDVRLKDVSGGIAFLYAHPGFEFRECPADFRIRDLRRVLQLL